METGANADTSLRDDLAKGLKEIEERDASTIIIDNETGDVVEPVDGAGEPEARDDGRDDKGRFAPKAKVEGGGETAVDPAETASAEQPAEDAIIAPPKSLRAEEAAEWANTPEGMRKAFLRREADAARLAGAQDAERAFGREFAEVVRPHMETIQKFGVTPQFAVQALLNNDRVMRTGTPEQKITLARQFITDYGLDPALLAQPDPNAPSDPHVAALQRRIDELQAKLTTPVQQQQFAPLPPSAEDATITNEIEAFRSDPAHPHFDAVRDRMVKLLETEAASDLHEAYQMAVAANPALRSTPPQPEAQRPAEKTAAARRASLSVVGSPGPSADPKPASLRDELRENLRSFGFMS
jgi:hypothetical protein